MASKKPLDEEGVGADLGERLRRYQERGIKRTDEETQRLIKQRKAQNAELQRRRGLTPTIVNRAR